MNVHLKEEMSLGEIKYFIENGFSCYCADEFIVNVDNDKNLIMMVNNVLTFACRYKKKDVLFFILSLKSHDRDIEILRIKKPDYYKFVQKAMKEKLLLES